MKPEETIDFPIKWAWHNISRIYNAEASKYGSTLSVGYVLLNIDFNEGTPSTSLGPKLGMEPTSLSRTLKNMEEQGLIERRPSKEDRRKVFVHLTDFGIEKREVSKQFVIRFNEELQKRIPRKVLNGFFESMKKINEVLNDKKLLE